jgi:hypothetical protein
MAPTPRLTGSVRVLFAFDIGHSIRLEACRAQVAELAPDERIRHKGHAPGYFQFDPPPLRLLRDIEPIAVAGRRTGAQAELLLYDFGGVSVGYTIPFEGTLPDLIELSCVLSGDPSLRNHAEPLLQHLLELIHEHVDRPGLADPTEGYLIFQIPSLDSLGDPDLFVQANAGDVARLLRSECDRLSDQEVQEALSGRVRFGQDDLCVLDWNAALLLDREPEDVVSVLEFANLQLLEVRFLDEKLDRGLDRAYEAIQVGRAWSTLRLPGAARAEMRRIAQMQVDGAILFERVSNALKLLGDQYLARVYRTASQRFRLSEWNTGILRKLDTLESIYQKVHDHASSLRMEALEWIIIVLIAVSIALPFLGWGK